MQNQIKSLRIKGFSDEEISKLLKIKISEVSKYKVDDDNITSESTKLYTEMQKDLSKLILTEMSKDKRDSSIILNAIKLQADLQEKKLVLGRVIVDTKIDKGYIYKRDEEIVKLLKEGNKEEDIAKKFKISVLSIKQAVDRFGLNLDDKLKTLSPSIISETIGLDEKKRLEILNIAYINKLNRTQVRQAVNKIKNEER